MEEQKRCVGCGFAFDDQTKDPAIDAHPASVDGLQCPWPSVTVLQARMRQLERDLRSLQMDHMRMGR